MIRGKIRTEYRRPLEDSSLDSFDGLRTGVYWYRLGEDALKMDIWKTRLFRKGYFDLIHTRWKFRLEAGKELEREFFATQGKVSRSKIYVQVGVRCINFSFVAGSEAAWLFRIVQFILDQGNLVEDPEEAFWRHSEAKGKLP
jgi:hypothetical protein